VSCWAWWQEAEQALLLQAEGGGFRGSGGADGFALLSLGFARLFSGYLNGHSATTYALKCQAIYLPTQYARWLPIMATELALKSRPLSTQTQTVLTMHALSSWLLLLCPSPPPSASPYPLKNPLNPLASGASRLQHRKCHGECPEGGKARGGHPGGSNPPQPPKPLCPQVLTPRTPRVPRRGPGMARAGGGNRARTYPPRACPSGPAAEPASPGATRPGPPPPPPAAAASPSPPCSCATARSPTNGTKSVSPRLTHGRCMPHEVIG
jgi:hypothetical protein